jgi:hypothetical protein
MNFTDFQLSFDSNQLSHPSSLHSFIHKTHSRRVNAPLFVPFSLLPSLPNTPLKEPHPLSLTDDDLALVVGGDAYSQHLDTAIIPLLSVFVRNDH